MVKLLPLLSWDEWIDMYVEAVSHLEPNLPVLCMVDDDQVSAITGRDTHQIVTLKLYRQVLKYREETSLSRSQKVTTNRDR